MTVQEAAVMRIDVDGESLTMTWTLQDLEAALEPLLERMRQPVERALRDSRIRPQELDAVVLAGGSTRLLAVRQLVTRLFGRFPEVALDPDEVVALGAAVQAALRGRDKALAERVMTDVCPYTLGIHVSRELGDGRRQTGDRKSTRLNSSYLVISYAVFCLKKKDIPIALNAITLVRNTPFQYKICQPNLCITCAVS